MSAVRRQAAVALTALAALACAAGCARKGAPTGGPADLDPPGVVETVPDSGQARVALDTRFTIAFSEGMEPRSAGDAIALAPPAEIRQRRWTGRTLTVVLAAPLLPGRTYTLIVDEAARDRHGNRMRAGRTVVFSTGDSFPPGRIAGRIEARGFPAEGTYLWGFPDGRAPDSTGRDFEALGIADADGRFDLPGLTVPGRYRLWAFADLNHNRSFEPDKDVLAPADTLFDLTAAAPASHDFALLVVNPRAPAIVHGAVVDSTGDSLGVLRVVATAEDDSSRRVLAVPDERGGFELTLDAGAWQLRAWRDHDRNRAWRADTEPGSPLERIRVGPAEELRGVSLRLQRLPTGDSGP